MVSLSKMNEMLFEIIDKLVDVVQHLLSLLASIVPGVRFTYVVVPGVELDLSESVPELQQFPVRCVVTLEQHLTAGAI